MGIIKDEVIKLGYRRREAEQIELVLKDAGVKEPGEIKEVNEVVNFKRNDRKTVVKETSEVKTGEDSE